MFMNNIMPKLNVILSVAIASSLLASCSLTPAPERSEEVHEVFNEANTAPANAPLVIPDSVNADLMAANASSIEMAVIEERFNVSANNVPVKPFLQGLVEDSPYSVAFHSGVEANVSLDLKDVTINEVMDVLTSLHPLDIQYRGKVIQVYPSKIKTETLAINYLMLKRFGMTSTNINSGGIVQQNGGGQNSQSSQSSGNFGNSNNQGSSQQQGNGNSNGMSQMGGSNIQTTSESDFWQELEDTLKMIMSASGDDDNSVVISPQSGLITVRGFPSEIMAVKNFVKLSEESLTRQVVLEAKIVEVALDDNYKQGINWQNVLADKDGTDIAFNTSSNGSFGDEISAVLGGVTSLTINNVDFGGVVSLLKTQGNVQVLSSPRVTATNNQKAVIKVGEDEYFVTDVSNTTVTGTATSSTPEINLEPFFSGIALDVTPQISDQGDVILHVHPSVTEIAEQQKVVTLNEEQYVLPLAKSNIRESDTVIRAKSGEIVVIGGLMQSAKTDEESRVPFLGAIPFLGNLFKSKQDSERKKELVILIRPTVVGTGTWKEQMQRSAEVLNRWYGDK